MELFFNERREAMVVVGAVFRWKIGQKQKTNFGTPDFSEGLRIVVQLC